MKCVDCKLYKAGECTWWYISIPSAAIAPKNCYLINDTSAYPLIPVQIPNTRTCKYPTYHGRCFYCGEGLKGTRRRGYCSDAHRSTYYARFNWLQVRLRVWNYDKNKCVLCHRKLDFDAAEVDHAHAISLGGGYWEYNNLRTLCKRCHRKKTGRDRRRLNQLRKEEQILNETIPLDVFLK